MPAQPPSHSRTRKRVPLRTHTHTCPNTLPHSTKIQFQFPHIALHCRPSASSCHLPPAPGSALQPVRLTQFKLPGAELAGILYLRDVADADALVAAIAAAKEAGSKVRRAACARVCVCVRACVRGNRH